MKKNRLIFYAVFTIFHVTAFIFTIIIENNTSILFSIVPHVPKFKYATLFGLLLIVSDFIWSWKSNKEAEKEKGAIVHELNMLKAKLFDLQESGRKTDTSAGTKS